MHHIVHDHKMWYHVGILNEGERKILTRLLIVDSCEEFRQALSTPLKERYSVRCCNDGIQALALLESFCPDLLIIDLMIQGVDGLGVIQAAAKTKRNPPALVSSVLFPDYVTNLLSTLNVVYAVTRPCEAGYLVERIDDLVANVCIPTLPTPSPYSVVTATLLELGMIASRTGFKYCRDAILMLEKDRILMVTKDIYPVLAEQYATSTTAVEKNIRDAIAAVWRDGNRAALAKYFPPAANGQIPRPSNHVFLSTLTEQLFSVQSLAK